ncbi:MAG: transporter substrate-binding domain-containing protein [Burkholderiales bacterium]|nr:transporter substrate-binding domain-containing protein [Burkholderiales bacterium]
MLKVRSLVGGVILALLGLCALVPAWAAQTVRVGVYQNSPKVALSDAGRAEGIFIDVIEHVAQQEGWTLEYVPGTWAEGLERLARGEIDLMPDVARNTEREALYGFHDEPVLASWNQVYTRKGSGVRTLLDLGGKRVAVLAGSVQERQLSQMAASFSLELQWLPRVDFDAAFAAVQHGEADAVVTNRFFGVRNAARYGLEDTAIIFSPSKLFFATPKNQHPELLAAMDRHLLALKKNSDSVYYRALRHWSVDDVRTTNPAWLEPTLVAGVALLLSGVVWVGVLRRQVKAATRAVRQRNNEILIVNRTLRATGSQRELSAVLDEATKGALALTGFDGGVLCLRDAQNGTLKVGARIAAMPLTDRAANGGPLCDVGCPAMLQTLASGQRHVLLPAGAPGTPQACGNVHDASVRWNAYFPLVVQGRTTGILCLFSRQPQPPDAHLLELVEDLCGPVALAMENARLYEQAQQHAQQLERRVMERTSQLAQTNAELLDAKLRAEAADRIKSSFLATMSHELRTPLNSIIGFTGIVLQQLAGPLNAEQAKQLGMVRDSSRHLLALINDVLDISKIEAGELKVGRAPFDLGASVRKVAAIVEPLADKKHLQLQVDIPADLGTMHSDARRVEQVLLNLLGNAIKFTDKGRVHLQARRVDDYLPAEGTHAVAAVRIQVQDTGMGIRDEDLSLLFMPFRQLDSELSRKHDGTGLGLAICRRLTELMGGQIQASSVWGQGSVFTVTLPLEAPHPAEHA